MGVLGVLGVFIGAATQAVCVCAVVPTTGGMGWLRELKARDEKGK